MVGREILPRGSSVRMSIIVGLFRDHYCEFIISWKDSSISRLLPFILLFVQEKLAAIYSISSHRMTFKIIVLY